MDAANSAAVASTPSVKGGVTLDSFDARVVEYQCAMRKMEVLITHVKAVHIKVRSQSELIPLVHCIITLAGPWVGGASELLRKRIDQVSRLELPDMRKTVPQVTTMAVPFDVDEQRELKTPDYRADGVNYIALVESLQSIFENTLAIYQAKLKQCLVERDANRRPDANHKPIPLDMSTFRDLIEPFEVMTLSKLVTTKADITTCHFKIMPFILDSVNSTLQNIVKYHSELQTYKKKPTDAVLKRLPAWPNTNHRIFACFVKLGELYNVLRKLGRELYLPVSEDLHSPKLLHDNVKLELALNNCDEFFKSSRRNEQMMFTLTRVTRQGSLFHIKRDTILSFIPSLEQSILLNQKLVEVLTELLKNWEHADAKERRSKLRLETQIAKEKSDVSRATTSPSANKRLSIIFNPEREKHSQEVIAKQQREREKLILGERSERERADKERQTVEDIKSKRRIEERERKLRDELIKERSPTVSRQGSLMRTRQRSDSNASTSSTSKYPSAPSVTTRQRSGSNASSTSTSSNSSVLNSMRNNSLNSAPVQRSPTLSRSPSVQARRPASVYMSSPAFDIRSELRRQEKAKSAASIAASASVSPQGLQRTPSLPTGRARMIAAAAGAANALKQDRQVKQERSSSLKTQAELQQQRQHSSPANAQRHQNHLSVNSEKRNSATSPTRRSPSPLRNKQEHLPDINELSIQELSVSTPPRPSVPKLSTPQITTTSVDGGFTSTPKTPITKMHTEKEPVDYLRSDIPETPSKSPSPVLKSSLQSPRTLDPSASSAYPSDVSNTTEMTSTESSISLEQVLDEENSDGKTLTTMPETPDTLTPKKIIKKVRFTGVPDEIEEDSKPKRKGWIHPPKILVRSNNKPQTSLSFAAQALVQQERVTFSNIKRGQLDVATGKVIYPDQKNTRIMSTLTSNGGMNQSPSQKGKWRIGGRLKDRFA